jgi:hypothetical protein
MVGTVLAGNSLKHKAALQRVITDFSTINTAFNQFYSNYGAWPGDMSNASSHWSTTNGNGNTDLDSESEQLFFWQHLKLSGLISGSYDGATKRPGIGVMAGPSELGVTGYMASSTAIDGGSKKVVITFSKFIGNTPNYAVITPVEMFNIESQYDNGKPGTLSITGNNLINGIVGTGASGACIASSNYAVNNSGIACYFEILLNSNLN